MASLAVASRAPVRTVLSAFRPRPVDGPGGEANGFARLAVALRSKPIAVLYGPSGNGKVDAARTAAQQLAGHDHFRTQEMIGHAWWASGVRGAAVFTAAQERFNREKVQALMIEAARDHQSDHVYAAVLCRISPAEWDDLARLAFQLDGGFVLGDPGDLPRRLPVSTRLYLIATADTLPPTPWDPLVLRKTSLLPWQRQHLPGQVLVPVPPNWDGGRVLDGAVKTSRAALRRLRGLPGWRDEELKPLLTLARTMNLRGVPEANRAASEALVYIANSWTQEGRGLLAPHPGDNLRQAVRLAIRLALVPRLAGRREPQHADRRYR